MRYFRTGDPESDFMRQDMERAMYEARLPVCDCCGEIIHDDDYYEIDNEILCEECMKDKYMKSTEDFTQID